MDEITKKARSLSGLAAFERNCGTKPMGGKMLKAWRVPGTQEAGRWAMLNRSTGEHVQRMRKAAQNQAEKENAAT